MTNPAKTWKRLAEWHRRAAVACEEIATRLDQGRPTAGARSRLKSIEKRGSKQRDLVLGYVVVDVDATKRGGK